MTRHALLALAVTLCLGGAAYADSTGSGSSAGTNGSTDTTTTGTTGNTGTNGSTDSTGTTGTTDSGTAEIQDHALPRTWEGDINNAFFADPEAQTLRPENEVRKNWSSLTAQQQAQVRIDCQSQDMPSSSSSSSTTSTDETQPPRESGQPVRQVCDMIDGM